MWTNTFFSRHNSYKLYNNFAICNKDCKIKMMKIIKNEENKSLIEELEIVNDTNVSISQLFLDVLANRDFTNADEIQTLAKNSKLPEEDIYVSVLGEYFGIDWDDEENKEIFEELVKPCFNHLEPHKYLSNPYYKLVSTQEVKDGKYELVIDKYLPYEPFPYKDLAFKGDYELNSFGFFSEEFPFIALNENGVTWMSITPNEIETMEKSIEEATGNVIVFGLGLGYYPFMISNKDEVKKVTIIESDSHIIKLFKKYLLPQFPNKEKIRIVQDDAFDYLNEVKHYDTAFVDLWHSPEDGIESYLKFKRKEKDFGDCKVSYWIESSLIALLKRCMITVLVEQFNGFGEESYAKASGNVDKIINRYYRNTKNLTLRDKSEIYSMLHLESLYKFIA